LVTDNLKAAVTKRSRYKSKVNETFADFAEHCVMAVLPTRAYKPRDKAIVENAVRIVYTRVFTLLRNQTFHTRKDINKAILEFLDVIKRRNNYQLFKSRKVKISPKIFPFFYILIRLVQFQWRSLLEW